jgi:hypothetical protein
MRTVFAIAAITWGLAAGALTLGGCSGAHEAVAPPADPAEAGAPADAGAVEASAIDAADQEASPPVPYPAPHAKMPLVTFHGGHVIASPAIVSITFEADPYAGTFVPFDDAITQTPWWDAVTAGYCEEPGGKPCIGRGASAGHVVMPAMGATTWQATDVAAWVQQNVESGAWPAPSPGILYATYLPSGVNVSLGPGFDGCTSFDGYHAYTSVSVGDAGATLVPYAVMLRCQESVDLQTLAMSHEFIEAATDPFGDGWFTDDPAWTAFFYPEVGDLCVWAGQTQESGYTVQPIWSNLAALAGHDPCVPAPPGEVYFGAAPTQESLVVGLGKSKTVVVQSFSEGPTGDWSLEAVDLDSLSGGPPTLEIDLDTTTANNGTVSHATITMLTAPPATRGYGVFAVVARKGSVMHAWPAVVRP